MAAAGHGVIWRRLRWLDGCDGCDLIAPNDSTRCVIPRDAMRCCRVKEQKEGGKRRVGASKTGIPWPARKGSRARYQELPLPPNAHDCIIPFLLHASRLTLHASRLTPHASQSQDFDHFSTGHFCISFLYLEYLPIIDTTETSFSLAAACSPQPGGLARSLSALCTTGCSVRGQKTNREGIPQPFIRSMFHHCCCCCCCLDSQSSISVPIEDCALPRILAVFESPSV
jgi:hypothetical protein